MSLTSGTRLGSYEIASAIGAGAMGEVYRARDTKLRRDVAIKVLPDLFAADPDRLARFEREAQVLASLNHPNIAQVYGVEDLPSQGGSPATAALIMEFVEGEDLSHRLSRRAVPIDDALPIAKQIVVLGTAAYMAPEQAKGRAVDKRADIWAFGCVLFELLAGRSPFAGDDLTEVIAAVVKDDPSWALLPVATPPAIRALLGRCLIKDPKQRLRDIGDARPALTEHPDPAAIAAPPAARSAWRTAGLAIGALILVAGTSGATWWWMMRAAPAMPVRRFLLATPPLGGFGQREFSISPEGNRIAYVAADKLYVWHLSELTPRVVADIARTGLGQIAAPFWSPDGTSVGYFAAGRLWRVSLRDGQPTVVCSVQGEVVGGAWRSDGTIVFPVTRGPMYQVPALGGEPSVLIPLVAGQDVDFHQPSVLPDGVSLVYALHGREGTTTLEVFAGGARKTVFRAPPKPRAVAQVLNLPSYSPTGHLVFRQDEGNIGVWAVAFSLSRLETTGAPFLVAAGARNPAAAADGTLVYAPTQDGGPTQLVWLRADGIMLWKLDEPAPRPYIPAMNVSYPVGFSADGRYFAYTSFERSEPRIYIRRFPAGDTQWEVPRVVTEVAIWPAGGKQLFAVIGRNLGIALAAIPIVAAGDVPSFGVPRTLFTTTTEVLGAGLVITPDGTRVLTVQHQVTDAPRTGIVVVQNWWAEFSGKQSTQ